MDLYRNIQVALQFFNVGTLEYPWQAFCMLVYALEGFEVKIQLVTGLLEDG